jgi:hypothetical protein
MIQAGKGIKRDLSLKTTNPNRAGGVVQVVECLLGKHVAQV